MALIRDDRETALNDLHMAFRHSADNYRDAAEFLDDPEASERCLAIARGRDELAERVAEEIRALGELPSVPDRDRETGEQLLQRLEAMFSPDETTRVLLQRRDAEHELLTLLRGDELAPLRENYRELFKRCEDDVEQTLAGLAQS
ncbi:hypothetical protein [Microbulbifer yueqingensis]|uniref:DUF2383 domain-containing protein n=1 Tax=Microbulbifer yueqingensis TaxID=658219 RepID=A0A1G9AEX8_9GAMM|nr:hypothetical protein [Microbulbifer yueqingensis]SDK25090.1 hypothetical protein SAMN05216212_1950 [Microbulbifer yueqingensis]